MGNNTSKIEEELLEIVRYNSQKHVLPKGIWFESQGKNGCVYAGYRPVFERTIVGRRYHLSKDCSGVIHLQWLDCYFNTETNKTELTEDILEYKG